MTSNKNIFSLLTAVLFLSLLSLLFLPSVQAGTILMNTAWNGVGGPTDYTLTVPNTINIYLSLVSSDETNPISYNLEARDSDGTIVATYGENNVGYFFTRFINVPDLLGI